MNSNILAAIIASVSSVLLVRKKRSIKGLKNLGNTCYINALLQALASSKFFTEWILSIPTKNVDINVPFIEALKNFLLEMQESEVDNLSAKDIVSALIFHRWNVTIGLEEDLFELLNVFCTTFEEEINSILNSNNAFQQMLTSPLFSTIIKGDMDMVSSNKFIKHIWSNNNSYKQLPFSGFLCTTIRCCNKDCLYEKIRVDPVGVISLSIPYNTFLDTLSLEFLLRNFFQAETIPDASCDKCLKEKNIRGSGIYRKDSFGKVSF
uniref:ubiquitinyl hydrolase 1 n=1 Tax=Parastrongyloides trichosuri TaxID=131310 RepID=A0A0N4ZUZ9_PARTI